MEIFLLATDRYIIRQVDGVSDRDYLIEFLSALSTIMMHLSRFSEEIIIWNSNEYQFVEIDDAYSTGSSIMPQKKNPDIAELVRGKTGRVYGALMSLLTTMKGIPLAYNKDMQEDKELAFDAFDTAKGCIALFTGMIDTMKFNKDVMRKSANNGFTNAMTSHDITFVGIIQTARASGLEKFPMPYVLTNCHNSLCAVGGTINEDDHMFGLTCAKKYGGVYVPPHQAVIHQFAREMLAGGGKMILGSDSHNRSNVLSTK